MAGESMGRSDKPLQREKATRNEQKGPTEVGIFLGIPNSHTSNDSTYANKYCRK